MKEESIDLRIRSYFRYSGKGRDCCTRNKRAIHTEQMGKNADASLKDRLLEVRVELPLPDYESEIE